MQNPFESGHVKNYIYLYASVVVIMVLFFIAATLFRNTEIIQEKVFNSTIDKSEKVKLEDKEQEEPKKFKLLQKGY